MQTDYLKAISNNGHQYKLRLLPSTCALDIQIVQNNLIASESSQSLFPPYSIKMQKNSANIFIFNLTFEGSVLQQNDLQLSIDYLTATATVPKTLIPDASAQKLAQYAPTAKTLITVVTTASIGSALASGTIAIMWPLINFQQIIGYFTYINVDYPLQVELFFSLFSFASLDFLPNPLASMTRDLADQVLKTDDMDILQNPSTTCQI